jgi:squalene-hopene/tetraprenyl-beta-curcumene cyclase
MTWLLDAQNADGGWGGDRGVGSTIEESGVVLEALAGSAFDRDDRVPLAIERGTHWLIDAVSGDSSAGASPVGLYFARLWYYEDLYPFVFSLAGLAGARSRLLSLAAT